MEVSELISCKVPTYLMSLFEMREMRDPMNSDMMERVGLYVLQTATMLLEGARRKLRLQVRHAQRACKEKKKR